VNAVDYTTVDSVVRDNRTQFRRNNIDLIIDNRPAAIYILRNYLSICVPDSIETSINNTITVYHRVGPEALQIPPIGIRIAPATAATSAAVRGSLISDVRKQLPSGGFTPPANPEDTFNAQLGKSLCVPQTNQPKDEAVREFFVGRSLVDDTATLPITKIPGVNVKQLLKNVVASVGDCKKKGFRNAFEVGRFAVTSDNALLQATESISDLQNGLRKKLKLPSDALTSGKLDKDTRQAIVDYRNANDLDKPLGGQVDHKLLSAVTKGL
jgi:hypothetical protein